MTTCEILTSTSSFSSSFISKLSSYEIGRFCWTIICRALVGWRRTVKFFTRYPFINLHVKKSSVNWLISRITKIACFTSSQIHVDLLPNGLCHSWRHCHLVSNRCTQFPGNQCQCYAFGPTTFPILRVCPISYRLWRAVLCNFHPTPWAKMLSWPDESMSTYQMCTCMLFWRASHES